VVNDRFPSDDNGDVLRRMEQSGDDLSRPRDIDFSIVFENEKMAKRFVDLIKGERYWVRIQRDEHFDPPWDVTVTINMVPTHTGITAMEEQLGALAAPLEGRNDGWGCFAVPNDRN
jgi:hypothetical protein